MPEKKGVDTSGLEKLKSFGVTEPTGLTDLPDLPDPESPEFQAGEAGTGIRIARAISVLLAGASDPNLASALTQHFAQQDLVARADAQERYKLALGRVEAQREEIGFNEEQRKQRAGEQVGAANVQLDAINASLRAAELEFRMTEDPDKKQQLPVTIAELEKLRDSIVGPAQKPIQAKSPMDLIGLVDPNELSAAMSAGTGTELVARFNAEQAAQSIQPKGLLSPADFEAVLAQTDDIGKIYARTIFAVAPDPRTDTYSAPSDSVAFGSALRGLAAHDPEAHDRVVEATTQAWVASGRVADLETAETIFADAEHNDSDPEQDPRLQPAKTFPLGSPTPTKFQKAREKLGEIREGIQKATNVQGKQQFRR